MQVFHQGNKSCKVDGLGFDITHCFVAKEVKVNLAFEKINERQTALLEIFVVINNVVKPMPAVIVFDTQYAQNTHSLNYAWISFQNKANGSAVPQLMG